MADIRRAGIDDWQELRDVRLDALADAPYAFLSTHAKEVDLTEAEWHARAEQGAWFIASQHDVAVGLVAVYPTSFASTREVRSMWVREPARGSHVAADLMNAALAYARDDGASELRLWVAHGNDRARRFYARMGFTVADDGVPLRGDTNVCEAVLRRAL
jgi:GNAT superfamily N-acetyltransferase